MNLAKLLEGPALITHRGVSFHSRGGAVLTPNAENFPIDSDAYGQLDQRAQENSIQLALTPVGVWTQEVLDVLYRWRRPVIGQLVTPRYDIASVDKDANEITILVSPVMPRKGCPVKASSFGTLPDPLAEDTTYFIGIPDEEGEPEVLTLHTSEADALAGSNAIDLTDVGTGDHVFIEQEPLIIHTYQNRRIRFWNAAIVGMPPINFSTQATLFGGVTLEAFRLNNQEWQDDNSLFTVDKAVLVDSPPDKAQIPTQEYALNWGAWANFQTRGPLTLTPQLNTTEISTDQRGLLSRKVSGVTASASGAPAGFSESELLAALQMQGGSIARGKSRAGADLFISGTGVYARLPGAAARTLPQNFSAADPRAGDLEWVGSVAPGEPVFDVSTTDLAGS